VVDLAHANTLNPYDRDTVHYGGTTGYSDYPVYGGTAASTARLSESGTMTTILEKTTGLVAILGPCPEQIFRRIIISSNFIPGQDDRCAARRDP
jgi:hypothetical protein